MTASTRITIDADILPKFTAAYLRIQDGECAFIEAHTAHALPRLLAALETQGKKPADVKYVVVTHAHLDHAAGAGALMAACPNATLLAHPRTAKHMIDPQKLVEGATEVYGKDKMAELYGAITPIEKSRVRALEDGETFTLGSAKLTAWHTYGHAFHHFILDDPAQKTVFTGDTFGLIYPALQSKGRFIFPSTSPTGFHATEAKKSIEKVLSLGEPTFCPTHFDVHDDARAWAPQLVRFIDRAAAWVDAAVTSGENVDALQKKFVAGWWSAIAEEAPHFGEAEKKLLELDVRLNADGLVSAVQQLRAKKG